jgi:flagellar biosynthesis anti-sigma factor FlgM
MKVNDYYTNMCPESGCMDPASSKRVGEEKGCSPIEADKEKRSCTRVEFSEVSMEKSKAAESMEKDSADRARKVHEIKMKIEQGTYIVDAGKVAEKMLLDALSHFTES